MSGMVHDAAALAAFQSGEERLVYARFRTRPADPPYYLPEGAASLPGTRAWVGEQLECLMPECSDRRLRLVNRAGSGRRDGFSHYRGAGGHSLEGQFHQQGKAAILAWVAEHYPHVGARAEVALTRRERIADVMLTWPDGARVAVEIQYAHLSVEEWDRRHNSYLAAGVTPVWLFGHHGAQMRTRSIANDLVLVRLSALHHHVIQQKAPLLWLNPIDATLGTPWTTIDLPQSEGAGSDRERLEIHPAAETPAAHLAVTRLADAELDSVRGIVSATATDLDRATASWLQSLAEHEQRKAEQEAEWLHRVEDGRRRERRQRMERLRAEGEILAATAAHVDRPPWTQCRRCGLRLDEILKYSGYHIGCEPAPIYIASESVGTEPDPTLF